MTEQLAHETLYTIRARVAALQATLEEADRSADDAKAMSEQYLAESQRLRETLAKVNARLIESESNIDKQRALAGMKDDALASMVEIYEKIQTYLGIDPGDMGERADGEILHRIHVLNTRAAELNQAVYMQEKVREERNKAERELATVKENLTIAQTRIAELVEQANAAYAPYRQAVMDARAETDKYATGLYQANARIAELEADIVNRKRLSDVDIEVMRNQQARIAELEAARRWVPPCDSTPEIDGYYLVSCDGKVSLSYYGSGWFWDILRDVTIEPDYWQLLPAAPEAANES